MEYLHATCGIEITATCPALLGMYRMHKVNVFIDTAAFVIDWEMPMFFSAAPGPHRLQMNLKALLGNGPSCTIEVPVEQGYITQVQYSMKFMALINPGQLQVIGKKPFPRMATPPPPPPALQCRTCGKAIDADSRFCLHCGAPVEQSAAARA